MRALFGLILALIVVALVWLGIRHADRLRCRLVLNKATYEFLNQKQETALQRAIALLERNPNYQPALESVILWLAATRQFDRALAMAADYGTTLTLSPLARYHLGICAYERGNRENAVRLFETLTSPTRQSTEISTPLITSYLAMNRGDFQTARTQLESVGAVYSDNLLYRSLLGRVCYAQDDMARATVQLEQAVRWGAQNPRTRLLLAICRALEADFPAMERLLDKLAAEGHDAYGQARSEIETLLERSKPSGPFISPAQQAIRRDRLFHLRLALATVTVRQNRTSEALSILSSATRDFPERTELATRQGLLYERVGRQDLALAAYQQEANRLFLAAYKASILDPRSTTATENAVWNNFATTGSVILDPCLIHRTVGRPADRGWLLSSSGEVWHTFAVPATGRYAIGLIARGDSAGGIWPIVQIHMDGQQIGELYVSSPVYDLFEMHVSLAAGSHWLRVMYVNNAVEPGTEGDRNLYLDKVIVRLDPN